MEEAWDLADGAGVIVAVIDTGVAHHPNSGQDDLANTSFVDGYDFVNGDPDPTDDHGHGTHVTGTIAQSTNNSRGVAGVAYNCSIMPIKVLNSAGSGTDAGVADGILFAANNGAQVINMSLGGSAPSTTLENAVAYAYNQGVTIICASGNDGLSQVSYPAAYDDYCIAVGATTYNEGVAYYSNGGSSLDLTAPGGNNYQDLNGDGYADGVLQQTFSVDWFGGITWAYYFKQGTSMAAPHVSGVAALVISNGVATSPAGVRIVLSSIRNSRGTTSG
jgi:serine protease